MDNILDWNRDKYWHKVYCYYRLKYHYGLDDKERIEKFCNGGYISLKQYKKLIK